MVKKSQKTEETRDKMVHIAFSPSEKKRIKHYAKESNTTLSEFIRQAIYDKIMRIDNPEKFGHVYNEQRLKEIEENQKQQLKMQELLIERMRVFNGINETMEALKPTLSIKEKQKQCEAITTFVKHYKRITLSQLEKLTNYDRNIILECITLNTNLILNEEGEVFLK